jgi:hypothetical protein
MTWSWMYWAPVIRLRIRAAFGGISIPSAASTALTDVCAWTVVHTPQMRCAQIHASRGSRPCRISSMPRNMVPEEYAALTTPPSTCASMRRCPSIRVTGSMTIRSTIVRS